MRQVILSVCLLVAACAPRVPENEFHIEGRIAGLRDSVVVTLFKYEGQMGTGIATDTVFGGRFAFIVPMTENAKLSVSGPYEDDDFPSMSREIFAVPGERITITGEGTLLGTWNVKSRIPQQREADAYIMRSKDLLIRNQQIAVEDNKARKITDPALRKAIRDSLNTLEEELDFAVFRNDIALMERTPVSEIWLDQLQTIAMMVGAYDNYASAFKDDAMRLYERLTPEQKELPAAQTIKFDLFPPEKVGVGDRMADAELKAFDGSMHKFSDYLGRYIVLDFWAAGCGPCYYSMPEMKVLGEKYPETLKIIGINLDTTEGGWKSGTELFKPSELNLNAPPESDIDERYGVNGIPHIAIISPEGIILDQWAGYYPGRIEKQLLDYINESKL
jgi:thiol-disulfide isomerase/thioredoxin